MAVTSQETSQEATTDRFPLLMERVKNNAIGEHVINIPRVGDDTSLHSSGDGLPHGSAPENVPSNSSSQLPATESPSSSNNSNYRSSSLTRNEEVLSRRWSPFNTVLWISIEVLFTLGQIIAAIVVLCLSRDEHPHTPLFAWVVGHVAGNLFSLPLYYWRYLHRNGVIDQRSSQESLPRSNSTSEPSSYITVSLTQTLGEEDGNNTSSQVLDGHDIESPHVRSYALIGIYKMALDCFFVVWFVVGNVWIFGGNSSSASDAPKLYRLCIVYLTFSCIGYALPFILCAMLCCCLPCIISVIGVREDNGLRGATDESINALPTHKFKMSKNGSGDDKGGVEDGGTVAAGTEKECAISGEDAVCCICLNEYEDGDELRELPCSHLFHTDCVDKWLKINASCPLCKSQIAVDVDLDVKNGNGNSNSNDNSTPVENSNHHQQQQG